MYLKIISILIIVLLFTPTLSEKFNNQPKIAFLFLIYDKINNEDLWNLFFAKAKNYSIYIHYKQKPNLKYFQKYIINNIVDTKWGDVSIVQAEINLLKNALQDKNNKKFIFVSGSCLPVKNYNHIYNTLIKNNKSHLSKPYLPKYCSFCLKSSQWCILDRSFLEKVQLNNLEKFRGINAPDELYFPTIAKENNLLHQFILHDTLERTTQDFWNNEFLTGSSGSGIPFNFDEINLNLLKKLINSKNLFARKFNDNCKNIGYLKNIY